MLYQQNYKRIMSLAIASLLLTGCASRPAEVGLSAEAWRTIPNLNVVDGDNGEGESAGTSAARRNLRPQYYSGTGQFTADATGAPIGVAGEAAGVAISFRNMDIRVIAQAILADTLGLSFSVDPRVAGTGTLESSSALSKDALRVAFEALLKTKGYALVNSSNGYVILPQSDAVRSINDIQINAPASASLPGFRVHVVTLKHTRPSELQRLIEPFSVPGGVLRADDNRNMLIVAGTSQELTAMFQAIETFDVDRMAGMSFAIYPLRYVDAEQIVQELDTVFSGPTGQSQSSVYLIPVPRINRVIGVAPDRDKLLEIENWIARLDIGESAPGRRIYVYDVKNGRAIDIATTLNLIVNAGNSGQFAGGAAAGNLGRGFRNTAGARPGNQFARNTGIGAGNGQFGQTQGGALSDGFIRIVPSEENNSIVIMATPSEFGIIETALKKIDVPPRQVLVEVTLAEVGLTDELRYGLQWHFEFGDNQVTFGQSTQPSPELPGFSWTHTVSSDSSAVLNALESISDVQVISAPKLLVLNNHSATLQIGDEVPVPTSTAVSTLDSNAPIVNTIQYRNTGVILTVTPRINEGGLVMLDVQQEVSTVVETSSSGIDAPTIQQRRMTSTVAVQNGSTIALGGLIRNSISKANSGVPILKDIPLLGNAFKNTNTVERRTELVILLTPRIIRNTDETREAMDYIRREFQTLIGRDKDTEQANSQAAVSPE